jgi:Serine dehydrogenase proteinase
VGAAERRPLIEEIQAMRGNSRLICCLTSDRDNAQGLIAKDFLFRFFQHLRTTPNLEKLDILLFTLGGDTLAAYALSRFVRQFAKTIGVLVPHLCLSGGTLFALGANDIVMTRLATLSSIDPSITGLLNPVVEMVPGPGLPPQRMPVPVAVESVAGFKKLVREEWRLDEEGAAQAFKLLADKVNPLLLGDLQRSKEQIVRLATNLMKLHMKEADKIASVAEMLATGLGSHDYLIGPAEARELALQVVPENHELESLIWRLYEDFADEMELGTPFDAGREVQTAMQQPLPRAGQPVRKVLKIVMIESLERADVWEREFLMMPPNQMQVLWNRWR